MCGKIKLFYLNPFLFIIALHTQIGYFFNRIDDIFVHDRGKKMSLEKSSSIEYSKRQKEQGFDQNANLEDDNNKVDSSSFQKSQKQNSTINSEQEEIITRDCDDNDKLKKETIHMHEQQPLTADQKEPDLSLQQQDCDDDNEQSDDVVMSSSTSTSTTSNDGIHSAFTFLATTTSHNSKTPIWKKYAAMFESWLILIWQLLLFGFIVGESAKSFCTSDEDCREGQVCNVENDSFCTIPSSTTTDPSDVPPPATEDCPFLDRCITWSAKIAILFILVFIVGSVIDDIDQASRIHRAGLYRLKNNLTSTPNSRCCHHKVVSFNLWAMYYARTYLIPYVAFCSTIAIIYADGAAITTQAVILNGLAVTFILSFDDALFGLFVQPNLQTKSNTAMEDANTLYIRKNDCHENKLFRIWVYQRVMCISYAGLSAWIIFNPIEAIKKSPSIIGVLNNNSYGEEYASCDDFINAIAQWPTILLIVFASLDKIVIGSAPIFVMIRDFFLGPIFLILFWGAVFMTMITIYTTINCE